MLDARGAAGPDRRRGRAVDRRRRRRARLPRRPGADRGALPSRPGPARRPPLPQRRPGPPAPRRRARVPRPRRPPGEDPRRPGRAGRDRGGRCAPTPAVGDAVVVPYEPAPGDRALAAYRRRRGAGRRRSRADLRRARGRAPAGGDGAGRLGDAARAAARPPTARSTASASRRRARSTSRPPAGRERRRRGPSGGVVAAFERVLGVEGGRGRGRLLRARRPLAARDLPLRRARADRRQAAAAGDDLRGLDAAGARRPLARRRAGRRAGTTWSPLKPERLAAAAVRGQRRRRQPRRLRAAGPPALRRAAPLRACSRAGSTAASLLDRGIEEMAERYLREDPRRSSPTVPTCWPAAATAPPSPTRWRSGCAPPARRCRCWSRSTPIRRPRDRSSCAPASATTRSWRLPSSRPARPGEAVPDPDSTEGATALADWLREPVGPGITRYLHEFWHWHENLREAWPDPLGRDGPALAAWAWDHGRHQGLAAELLLPAAASGCRTPGGPLLGLGDDDGLGTARPGAGRPAQRRWVGGIPRPAARARRGNEVEPLPPRRLAASRHPPNLPAASRRRHERIDRLGLVPRDRRGPGAQPSAGSERPPATAPEARPREASGQRSPRSGPRGRRPQRPSRGDRGEGEGPARRSSDVSTGPCPEPGRGSSAGSSRPRATLGPPTGHDPGPGASPSITSTEFRDKPPYAAWPLRAQGGLEVRELPVGHIAMLRQSGSPHLARCIEELIDEAMSIE